jgi:hypothetical protein
MIGSSHQENQREQKPPQNDHRSLPKASCLHILEIAIESVAMNFLLLLAESAYKQPRKLSLSAPARIDFLSFLNKPNAAFQYLLMAILLIWIYSCGHRLNKKAE